MATKVASLFGVLSLDDKDFIKGLGVARSGMLDLESDLKNMGGGLTESVKRVGDKITEIGGKLSVLGGAIETVVGPLVGFGQDALDAAVSFDEAMKNIQAAAGYTGDEIAVISDQVLAIGETSRYGPQLAAEAFYEIAGGVSDASARMGTFEAAISAAQAGNADLGATTSAMIAIMNDYGFSADQASFASDVLTRMVGTGVGSMDAFAGAIPKAASSAAALGISFDNVGSQMAFLTTKGFTASEAATKLTGMMSSLVSPSKEVADAIAEAGYASGRAMIEAEGLAGAYEILAANNGGNLDGLIKDQEALSGATALTADEFKKFDETFKGSTVSTWNGQTGMMAGMTSFSEGIQGATTAAEDVQMTSTAAQFDLLTSSVDTLKVSIGEDLLPVMNRLINETLLPVVQGVKDWVAQNPQATTTIMLLVGAVALLGVGLSALGAVLTGAGVAIAALASPALLVAIAIGGLAAAFLLNIGGIQQFIEQWGGVILGVGAALLLFSQTTYAVTALGWAMSASAGLSAAAGVVWSFMTGIINFLAVAFGGAGVASLGMGAKFMIAVGPILAVAGAIIAVIAQVNEFMRVVGEAQALAQESALTATQNGASNDDIFDQTYASTAGQFGGGAGGNAVASVLAPVIYNSVQGQTGAPQAGGAPVNPMGKASGGPVMGGMPYTVGEQGREVFIPDSNGRIMNNADTEAMMGSGVSIGNINVYAETAAGGRAAADAFGARLREQLASK